MEINKFIIILTFIPWIAIYGFSMVKNLNNPNYQTFSFKYFKKNFFRIFRIDTLFLIIAFWYFSSFDKEFVNIYLFAVMVIYLFVNQFYEKKEKFKKHFIHNNLFHLILIFLIMLIPIILYFTGVYLVFVYKMMFILLYLEYPIILIISYIIKSIKKILKKCTSKTLKSDHQNS
jgi:hypothetical protein